MQIRPFMPFGQATKKPAKKATVLDVDDQKAIRKALKVGAVALGFNGLPGSVSSRSVFEAPDVDFTQITEAINTDSYLRQGFAKYRELMWKEGWTINSENDEAVKYLFERIEFMEAAMRRPFNNFMADVADQLVKYGNAFVVKARGDLSPYYPRKLYTADDQNPILGYYMIPTQQVEILRDKHNHPRWYRQRTDAGSVFSLSTSPDGDSAPKWNARNVIHFYLDKEPGKAFGNPFVTAVLDDIKSLRTMEEDALNLYHQELFPLYKYRIGTDEHPADDEEMRKAISEIEDLRTEGALIMPHRHDVEVIGGEGKAMDPVPMMEKMKERIAAGLGMFPHHLGMTGASANRSMTDRLDTIFYDKIKSIQREFAEIVRHEMFNELLLEGGFQPFEHPSATTESDRCVFKFNEIDIDTKIKKQTHTLQLYAGGAITSEEARLDLDRDPALDEAKTLQAMQVRMMPDQPVQTKTADGKPGAPKIIDTTPSAAKGSPNAPNTKKGPANVIRPTNQFGTRTSPNVKRSDTDDDWLREVVELLDDTIDITESNLGDNNNGEISER